MSHAKAIANANASTRPMDQREVNIGRGERVGVKHLRPLPPPIEGERTPLCERSCLSFSIIPPGDRFLKVRAVRRNVGLNCGAPITIIPRQDDRRERNRATHVASGCFGGQDVLAPILSVVTPAAFRSIPKFNVDFELIHEGTPPRNEDCDSGLGTPCHVAYSDCPSARRRPEPADAAVGKSLAGTPSIFRASGYRLASSLVVAS